MRLENKVCYVTGAASGIGAAIAERFLQEGARVAMVDRNQELLNTRLATLSVNAPERVNVVPIDVREEGAVRVSIDHLLANWSRLDVAVNCAGILGPVGKLHLTASDDYLEAMDNNLHGIFYCMKHELGVMQMAGRGSIINISSAAGLVGFPTAATYTAAKHGVIGLTRTCAIDYAEGGIRVNAIAPGGVDTPLIRATTCATPEGRQMIESLHPMKRLGQPEEIANAALFLASDEASFVTGEVFSVDGGWVAC